MKSKYLLWTICLLSMMGCKKFSCEFSSSPTQPRAGEVVTFTNESTGADDYLWNFGDNTSSTTSSPTHIYRKPGTYIVTLEIVRNKVEKRRCSHQITVIDTIPAIGASSDSLCSYVPATFTAQVYNPWKKTLTYHWEVPDYAVVIGGKDLDSSAVRCYFTQANRQATIRLHVQIGDTPETTAEYTDYIYHTEAPAIVYKTGTGVSKQFVYTIDQNKLYQTPQVSTLEEDQAVLDQEQDTMYVYGDSIYTIHNVSHMLGTTISGFQVDRLMAKIYAYNPDGLWVCNINGTNIRQLLQQGVKCLKVDGAGNRLYWANTQGVFANKLIDLRNNQGTFSPEMINTDTGVTRISVNYNLH